MAIGAIWRGSLAVLLVLLTGACTPTPPPPFVLFPDAARVVSYASPTSMEIRVDKQGDVSPYAFNKDGQSVPAPIIDGGPLTPAEVQKLRAAISVSKTPASTAMCCSPRHTFLFYDKAGRYLGFLSVCFECGCVRLYPFNPERRDFPFNLTARDPDQVNWDETAIKQIVEAHHLTPLTPPRS